MSSFNEDNNISEKFYSFILKLKISVGKDKHGLVTDPVKNCILLLIIYVGRRKKKTIFIHFVTRNNVCCVSIEICNVDFDQLQIRHYEQKNKNSVEII